MEPQALPHTIWFCHGNSKNQQQKNQQQKVRRQKSNWRREEEKQWQQDRSRHRSQDKQAHRARTAQRRPTLCETEQAGRVQEGSERRAVTGGGSPSQIVEESAER